MAELSQRAVAEDRMKTDPSSILLQPEGFLERLLPLRHWLSADSATGFEQGQARTRLICTAIALLGFLVAARYSKLPDGIVVTAIVYALYAVAWSILTRAYPRRPARGEAWRS